MFRRIQLTLGFHSSRQLQAWLLSGGILACFSLFSLRFLPLNRGLCALHSGYGSGGDRALPGECLYFLKTRITRLGIATHLYCIVPAGVLASLQFVPALRRGQQARVHHAVGYASLVLGLLGSVAALPVIRHAFGGGLAAQSSTGMLLVMFVVAQVMGWFSIRQKSVRHHRIWMLRSWVYASTIITMRVIMIVASISISILGGYYLAMPCEKIAYILRSRDETLRWYPECALYFTGEDPAHRAVVDADVAGMNAVQLVAAFNLTYGMSAWLGLFFHVFGLEIYIEAN
ncbi:hypothetical protein F5Y15DRAFT_261967 [Xylariaceae sp. FL0016]|nr:hypothetical protein F5Y15DRAFT_261967 [Xylariaceae sp. FL0016]